MNVPDIANLNYTELATLRDHVRDRMKEMRETGITQLRATIAEQAQLLGVDFADLLPKKKVKGGNGSKKYRDPDNAENTWGGKGPKPAWLTEALDSGRSLDEFVVT
jgi:DNA-binding protein H-NS